jgi:hypothetical protein
MKLNIKQLIDILKLFFTIIGAFTVVLSPLLSIALFILSGAETNFCNIALLLFILYGQVGGLYCIHSLANRPTVSFN